MRRAGLIATIAIAWRATLFAQSAAGTPVCRAVQLEPFDLGGGCGSGKCQKELGFRNRSQTTCVLPGLSHIGALDQHGRAMPGQDMVLPDGQPVVLEAGEFGEFVSESYAAGWNKPPGPAKYVFRFAPDDKGAIVFPGNQALLEGPRLPFTPAYPVPSLADVHTEHAGAFALSATKWPWPEFVARGPGPAWVAVHLSVTNGGAADSPGWDGCRVIVESTEEEAPHAHRRVVHPCSWNGDIARGVIETGATVATEIEATLPMVCRLARYTVTVTLEGAPAHFAPITLHTDDGAAALSDAGRLPRCQREL
jgi:hypothetical protein